MKKNYGLIAAAVIILFSVYIYINALTITSTANAALGPAFMPKMVAIILFILGWLDFFEELKKKKAAALKEQREEIPNPGAPGTGEGSRKTSAGLQGLLRSRVDVFSALLLLFYVFTIKSLGFLIASAIYMLLQMLLLTMNARRNYILIISMSLLVPCIIYFGFVKIFYLMLPPGILG